MTFGPVVLPRMGHTSSRWTPSRIESRTQMTTPSERQTVRLEGERLALGRYRLEHRIGAGGFGVVWKAHDTKLEREVAVKVVPRERDDPDRPRVER